MTGASSRRKVHEAVTLNKVVGSHLTPSLAVLDALQLGQGLSVFKHQATTVTSSSLLVQHLDGLDPLLANSMATGALKEKTALLIHPSTSNSAAATTTATTTTTTTTTTASSSTTSAASPPTMLLLDAATDYYHGERTATLALTAALLRAAEDPAHGWCATANEFIQRQNITASATATAAAAATTCSTSTPDAHVPQFVVRLINQFQACTQKRVPAAVETSSKRSLKWVKQALREQLGLLEIIFLIYYSIKVASPQEALHLISLLYNRCGFGLVQANESLFDAECRALKRQICHLAVVVAVEVLNLESLLDMDEGTVSLGQQEGGGDELQGEETTNPPLHLIHDPEAVFSLNELITLKMMQTSKTNSSSSSSDSINAVIYGPILLAWSCILNKLGLIMDLSGCPPSYHRIRDAMSGRQLGLLHNHGGNSSSSLGQVLVERAYQLDVIPQLTACFKSACYSDEDDNSLGYSSVMKGLLNFFITCYPIHRLPNFEASVICFSELFSGKPDLCLQFWEQDFPIAERRSILDTCRSRFPLQFSPLVKLLSSLIGCKRTANYAFNYFKQLFTFTELFSEDAYLLQRMPANQPGLTSGNGIGSGAVCLWKGERGLVPGVSLDMRMDALEGAKASILSTKPIIVQLHHKYSGWHLFLAMLDSFLQSSGWGSSSSTAAAGSASPYGSFTPGSISSSSSSSSVSSEYQVDWNSSQHPSKELVTLVLHLLKRVLVFADRPFFHHFMAHLGEFPSPTINGIEPAYIVTLFNRVLSRCCQIGGDVSSSSNSSGSNGGGYVSASGGSSSAMDNQPATALLTACVDTISMFLGSYPELIWMHLRHEPFMPPLFIGMDDGIDPPGSFWGSSGSIGSGSYLYQTTGYLQQVILPYEKSVGKYTTTLSFLHLVFKLIDEAQRQSSLVAPTSSSTTTSLSSSSSSPSSSSDLNRVKTQVLMSCLSFIHSDIFPTYNNWRYTNISEKFEIGLKVVVIFNMIMRDTSVVSSSSPLGKLNGYLLKQFLQDASLNQIVPLLDMVGVGNNLPELLYRRTRMKEARILEKSIVQAMVFLKELLKRRSGANSGAKTCGQSRSLLEHALLDRSVRGGAGGKSSSSAAGGGGSYRAAAEGYSGQKDQLELIHVIGNYINYNYNFDIPLLATEVLTYLCAVASDWEPRPPSFVGYFGDSASQIVASFVSLASDSYDGLGESSTDASRATGEINTTLASREALQTAIFNFVGTVIETQPGLGMLFLTGSDSIGGTQSINSSKSTTEGSILSAVVAHLSHHEKVMSSKPSLLPAIVRFLDVLWQKAPEYTRVLDRLRNGDCATKFWDGLKSILSSVANNVSMPPTSLTRSVTIDGGDISSTDATTANTTSQLFARPQGIDVYREQLGFGGFIQSWMDGQFTMADVGKCIPRSLLDDRVKIYCNGMVVKAHVVRILALEIYHGLRQQQQGKPTVDKIGPIATKAVEFIKSVFSDRNNVSKLFLRDCDCAYDPNKMTSALSTASQGVYVVKDSPSFDSDSSYSRVTVDLNAFQVSTWENYFDTGRVYGDGYVYDLELLAVKYGIANELPPLSEYEDDENTMDGGYATSSPAATAGWGFLSQVCAANHNFSITDAEIVMLRSWRFFIEVISSRTGYILWDQSLAALAPGSKKASEDLFNLIITLSNIVSEEKRSGFVMVSYRSEICELLVFLARHWIETHGQRLTDSASTNTTSLTELFQNVVDLMDSLKNCLLDDIFPVVENPHPFHQSLLTVLLLVLRMSRKIISRLTAISPSTATTATMVTTLPSLIKKHQENVIALFPVVSTCLSAHFAKVKQDSATVLDHLGASSSSSSYGGVSLEKSERVGLFSILLSVMNEFINADQKIEPTIWLPIIEKAEIISDLLTCFSLTISIATSQAGSGGMDLDSAAVNDCTSISKNPTKYTHEILYLLISLAAVPVAAERLAVHGILSTFSNNSFSPTIADGNVQAYIRHHERNPWHVTWCLMLSVMSRMLSNLVDSSLFVNGALSFTGLYWGQISRVLSLNSDNNNSEPDLLLGELEEIQRISQIFYHLGLYMSRQSSKSEVGQSNNIQLLFGYQGRSLLLMRYYVYLFMHPHMLSSKVMAISRDEKEMKVDTPSVVGEQGSTPAGAAGAPSSSSSSRRAGNNSNNISSVGGVLEELFQAKMLNICKNIMRFLVLSTNAESILVRICGRKTGQRLNSSIVSSYNHDGGDGSGGDNGGAVLFSPTMVIYSGANQEEVTLGTLVDLMGYVLDFLQKYHGSATNATTATTTTTTGFPSKNGVSNTLRKGSFGFGSGGGGGSSGGVVASAAQTLQSLVTQDALLELTEITYVMMITQVVSFLSLPHVELSQKREAVVELSTELESSASLVQSKLKSIGGGGTVALIDHLFNETAKVEGSVFTQIMAI